MTTSAFSPTNSASPPRITPDDNPEYLILRRGNLIYRIGITTDGLVNATARIKLPPMLLVAEIPRLTFAAGLGPRNAVSDHMQSLTTPARWRKQSSPTPTV